MQSARLGLKPKPVTTIKDEDGNLCGSAAELGHQWRRHFSKVFNIESAFSIGIAESVEQQDVSEELADPPTLLVLQHAISRLLSGKLPGQSHILPEMVF